MQDGATAIEASSKSSEGSRGSIISKLGAVSLLNRILLGHVPPASAQPHREKKVEKIRIEASGEKELDREMAGLESLTSPGSEMPGGWCGDDGKLFSVLPLPFLDGIENSKESFDGLFGVRYAKELSKSAKKAAQQLAKDRALPIPFPQSFFASLVKIFYALGPKNEVIRKARKERIRMRTERAVRALGGFELGERLGRKVREGWRRERKLKPVVVFQEEAEEIREERTFRAATPMSFLFTTDSVPSETVDSGIGKLQFNYGLSPLLVPITEPPKPILGPVVDVDIPLLSPIVDESFTLGGNGRRRSSVPSLLSNFSTSSPLRPPSLALSIEIVESDLIRLGKKFIELGIEILIGSAEEGGGGLSWFIHAVGLSFFLLVHTIALGRSAFETIFSIYLFLKEIGKHLRLKTELSRVVLEYFLLCRKEWMDVYQEDLAMLGIFNTLLSLAEMAAVQSMTKERFLLYGPGKLTLLNGQQPPELEELNLGRKFEEVLLVKKEENSILEATLLQSPISRVSMSFSASLENLPALDLDDLRMSFSPPLLPIPNKKPIDPLTELLDLVKRHVKLSTASYGLHTYREFPSTLSSPSNLSSNIFQHLSGMGKNEAVLYCAIQEDLKEEGEEETYAPQFYLVLDDLNLTVLVVFRGTQSLPDIKTDLEAQVRQVELSELEGGEKEVYLIHGGILLAAERLLRKGSELFDKLVKCLEENPDYSLTFSGHSLGAAISSAAALLASSYILDPENPQLGPRWVTNSTSGLPPNRPIRAITFAHPATVNLPLSLRAAKGSIPLVLSIILASDIVARMGLPQIRETRRTLGRLANKRRKFLKSKKKDGKGGFLEHGQSEILVDWWRFKRLGGGGVQRVRGEEREEEGGEERKWEVEERRWRWRMEMDGFNESIEQEEEKKEGLVPAGKVYLIDRLPQDIFERRRQESNSFLPGLEEEEEEEEERLWGIYEVGEVGRFFNLPLLELEMISSHLPRNYLDAVESL